MILDRRSIQIALSKTNSKNIDWSLLQPASLDLRLHPKILFQDGREVIIDPNLGFSINPGDFIIASTIEFIDMPKNLSARCEGKSSIGRIGLCIHITAGFIDPGFSGQITLEIKNLGMYPIIVRPGIPIAQIVFQQMMTLPDVSYGERGHYQNQEGPTLSRFPLENGQYNLF